ncbi:hypothetical protein VP1G_10586 [Cytospora mali]|uniref:Uncharacterized protein n=1 Tax=Cytospora mali TaxID=578113 RepID=A0A194UPP9_CYTMA|nr:hypothetical protein VP1G_10586 [Valsa mali var. pyri (nom. inval.)]
MGTDLDVGSEDEAGHWQQLHASHNASEEWCGDDLSTMVLSESELAGHEQQRAHLRADSHENTTATQACSNLCCYPSQYDNTTVIAHLDFKDMVARLTLQFSRGFQEAFTIDHWAFISS